MGNKANKHLEICKELNDMYIRKNSDYGDSFSKVRSEVPNAIVVRLMDKIWRIKTLTSGSAQQVDGESIDDNLMDLANYCILELIERAAENER